MLPDPLGADEDGLVGLGADLEPETLVDAYRRGIFPWPHGRMALPWFSPDPRAVLRIDGKRYAVTLAQDPDPTLPDYALAEVKRKYGNPPPGEGGAIFFRIEPRAR